MRRNRSREILDFFMKQPEQSLLVSKIAEKYGISERQVKNYMKSLNKETSPNTIIESLSANEYRLASNYKEYLPSLSNQEFLPKHRISNIISKLLLSDTPLDLFDLSDEMYVSRPTIELDLNKIKQMVHPFHLQLQVKSDCVSLLGSEKDKRKFTSHMINSEQYSDIMSTSNAKYLNEDYQSNFLKDSLSKVFDQCHFIYNDYSLNNIVLHLIITIDRLKRNNELTEVLPSNLVTDIEKGVANRVATLIENEYDVKFPDFEMTNLALFLSCNLSTVDYNFVNTQNLANYVSLRSMDLTKKILDMIKNYNYIDEFDDIFVTRFSLHINNLLKRLHNHYSVRNPITDEFMSTYPLIYDLAVSAADIIHRETGYIIEQDEIALIALHLGSFLEDFQKNRNKLSVIYIYNDYHGFYQLNLEKIQKQFHDSIVIKYSISVDDYANSGIKSDLIISECALPDKDILRISPFVTDIELSLIYARIEVLNKKKKNKEFQESFTYMFNKDLFFSNVSGSNEAELIRNILDEIKPLDYFQPGFPDDVIHREKLSSTCFHNGLAIPHSISQQVNRSFISFTRFDKGQNWNGEIVYLVIVIGIAYPERKMFRSVFNQLVTIFTNEAHVLSISKCKTYEDIVAIINQLLL